MELASRTFTHAGISLEFIKVRGVVATLADRRLISWTCRAGVIAWRVQNQTVGNLVNEVIARLLNVHGLNLE